MNIVIRTPEEADRAQIEVRAKIVERMGEQFDAELRAIGPVEGGDTVGEKLYLAAADRMRADVARLMAMDQILGDVWSFVKNREWGKPLPPLPANMAAFGISIAEPETAPVPTGPVIGAQENYGYPATFAARRTDPVTRQVIVDQNPIGFEMSHNGMRITKTYLSGWLGARVAWVQQ